MALFGDNKKTEKKEAKGPVRHARAKSLAKGLEHEVIRTPWLSEKSLLSTEKGVYSFAIPPRATKADVAAAIKALYNVAPKAVRVVNLPAKRKALRTRRGMGVRAARRKAYVYLNAGDTIQFA